MNLIAEIAIIAIVSLVLLLYLGTGLSILLLPRRLTRWWPLLAPWVGFCLLAIVYKLFNSFMAPGWVCIVVALVLSTVSNTAATLIVRRTNRPPRVRWPDVAIPSAISIITFVVSMIPIASYGYLTVVGTNADIEQYLSTSEYLRLYSVPALTTAAPNPLLDMAQFLASHPQGDLGFSYALSMVSLILGKPSISVFFPLIALFHALIASTTFVFCRSLLRISRVWAAYAAILLGLNGLVLWTTFFGYARQITALSLLMVGVIFLQNLLSGPTWRKAALLALIFAGLVITYWPATLWFVLCAVVLGGLQVASGRMRIGPVLRTLAIVGVCSIPLILALLGSEWGRGFGFAAQVMRGEAASDNQVFSDFLLPGHLFGLPYYVWPQPEKLEPIIGDPLSGAVDIAQTVLLAIGGLVCAIALIFNTKRCRIAVLAMAVTCAGFILWQRFGFNDRYSYFKALTFAIPLATALLAAGYATIARLASKIERTLSTVSRAVLILSAVCFLLVGGLNTGLTVRYFVNQPQGPPYASPFMERMFKIEETKAAIPADSSICITSHQSLMGWLLGPLVYALIGHPLYGTLVTLEWGSQNQPSVPGDGYFSIIFDGMPGTETGLCDYGLFAPAEDPVLFGYASEPMWRSNYAAMYPRGSTVARMEFPYVGMEPQASPTITWFVEARAPETAGLPVKQAESLSLQLDLVSFSKQTVHFEQTAFTDKSLGTRTDSATYDVDLEPGFYRFETSAMKIPYVLSLHPSQDAVFIRQALLRTGDEGEGKLLRVNDSFGLLSSNLTGGSLLSTSFRWLDPQPARNTDWLDLVVQKKDDPKGGDKFGRQWLTATDGLKLDIDLDANSIVAKDLASSTTLGTWTPKGDGHFSLRVRLDSLTLDAPPSASGDLMLIEFDVVDGRIKNVQQNPQRFQTSYSPRPGWVPLSATFGDLIDVTGLQPREDDKGNTIVSVYGSVDRDLPLDWRLALELTDRAGQPIARDDANLGAAVFADGPGQTVPFRLDLTPRAETQDTVYAAIALKAYSPATLQYLAITRGQQQGEFTALTSIQPR